MDLKEMLEDALDPVVRNPIIVKAVCLVRFCNFGRAGFVDMSRCYTNTRHSRRYEFVHFLCILSD